jgi:tRNA(fMet)-specific endonuclease VapC
MILLDTDVCVEILHKNVSVLERRKQENDSLSVSFMTAAELYYGAAKSTQMTYNRNLVEKFLLTVNIIHSDVEIVRTYGELKAQLEKTGIPLADADLLIAATAIEKCTKLITGNSRHYKRIEQLRIEDWIR